VGQSCKAFIDLTIHAKIIGGGRPLVPEILSQSDRVGAKFEQWAAITPKRCILYTFSVKIRWLPVELLYGHSQCEAILYTINFIANEQTTVWVKKVAPP